MRPLITLNPQKDIEHLKEKIKQLEAKVLDKKITKSKSNTHGNVKIRSEHLAADALKSKARTAGGYSTLYVHPNQYGQYPMDNSLKNSGRQPKSLKKSDKHKTKTEESGQAKRSRSDFTHPVSPTPLTYKTGPPPPGAGDPQSSGLSSLKGDAKPGGGG